MYAVAIIKQFILSIAIMNLSGHCCNSILELENYYKFYQWLISKNFWNLVYQIFSKFLNGIYEFHEILK